ncbi:hypothetical protein QBZ16_002120 [Prototheca wickerhamii]|uniref:RING-type E3 ubiquitin transferase n=1 Tax=Prototheca wickerhamii TaxID=3111 RepID=A0AAD9MLH4_PROWI|nr:hypothetical protein QBZ16_002120 [Prototheca wickerhamii]
MALLTTGRYVVGSALLTALVVWQAFVTREQFYPAVVFLSTSKICLAIFGNMGFAMSLVSYKLITLIFLGSLRDSEVQRVSERVGQSVLDTLLATTIFRQDISAVFIALFVVMCFLKIYHWLLADRIDYLETSAHISLATHVRLASFGLLLLIADGVLLQYTLGKTVEQGISPFLLFAFDAAVAASSCVVTLLKYAFSAVDMVTDGSWEGKGTAVFYLELTLDLLHLIIYAIFFGVVFSTYGIPIYLIRDLYWTFRNFQQRVRDFLRYRRLTANMDTRFPTATEADLERAGHTCIICREDLTLGQRPKRLACGHVFHVHCLRSWLERQQLCPICRAPVVEPRPAERPAGWGPIQPDPLAECPHRPRPRQFRPDDPSAPPELRNAVAHHQQASAATSFVLAACLAPEGQGMAAPHRQALRELLQTPGMRGALRAAAQGLQATL